MQILSVIPILKGVAPETLTYYSSNEVALGALVRVPVRGKSVSALVTHADEASSSKTDIKRLAFTLKKIDGVIAERCFSEAFMSAISRVADYHAASLGSTLFAIVPKIILENCAELVTSNNATAVSHVHTKKAPFKLIQSSYAERISQYKALIRESFAHHRSTIVLAPTMVEAEKLFIDLSQGIKDRAFLITAALPKKKFMAAWHDVLKSTIPVVVIGTSISAALSRADIGTFIVEHESSPYYKSHVRPFIDTRIMVSELAVSLGASVVAGDIFARIETSTQVMEEGDESIRASFRQERMKVVTLVDMSTAPESNDKKRAISPEAIAALSKSAGTGKLSFVYTLRKGHSGFTVCRDCGTVLTCDRCDAPMVLHLPNQKNGTDMSERFFKCHRCGRIRDTHTVCGTCSSWRLEMYGLGVDKVAEMLAHDISDIPLFMMSADTVTTHVQARKLIDEWKASTNGILVGTDIALPYLRGETLGAAGIASVDTLLALPDIGMPERVFRLVSELADAAETLIVQTRRPEVGAFSHSVAGDGWEFYRQEIEKRKMLSYPPYTTLIKVTRRGDEQAVMRDLGMIHEMALPYQTVVYPAFIARVNNIYNAHALISIPQGAWPDERLITQLRGLPPAFIVNVAPESVL